MERDFLGLPVHDAHVRRQRHNLVVKPAGCLAGSRSLLALQCVFVLCFAADVVTFRNHFGCVDHRHQDVRMPFHQARVCGTVDILMFILDKTDRLKTAADHDVDVIANDRFCGESDGHHAG